MESTEERTHERWPDDSDVQPPPVAQTIAAIRTQLGNHGSPLLDVMLGNTPSPDPVVAPIRGRPPWLIEGITYGEWIRRERAAGRAPKHYRRNAAE